MNKKKDLNKLSFSELKEEVEKLEKKKEIVFKGNAKDYKIVRAYSAGVFAGYLVKKEGKEVILKNVRRIWYWEGAASLSQLAMDGTSLPDKCKFPCAVSKIELTEAIEILDVTEKAKKSIEEVPVWQK